MFPRRFPLLLLWCGLLLTGSVSAEPDTAAMLTQIRADRDRLTKAIGDAPDAVGLYSRRGDCQLFLGEYAAAVADFEKMIALDATQDAPHWRLGIAYYFAGQWEKSAAQFEKYHSYDGRDRENGIWKFLADTRRLGLERARQGMLEYTRFDREPFPALYEMLAGQRTTDDVLADLAKRGLATDERVMFFAHYYCGLNEALLGRRERAVELTGRAAAAKEALKGEGGPAYMWQVARLHAARLAAGEE